MRKMSVGMKRLIFSGVFFAAMLGFFWLVAGEASPFHHYFLYHVDLPNIWMGLNFPAFIVATLVSGNVHNPSDWVFWPSFTIQWLAIGFLISLIVVRQKR